MVCQFDLRLPLAQGRRIFPLNDPAQSFLFYFEYAVQQNEAGSQSF